MLLDLIRRTRDNRGALEFETLQNPQEAIEHGNAAEIDQRLSAGNNNSGVAAKSVQEWSVGSQFTAVKKRARRRSASTPSVESYFQLLFFIKELACLTLPAGGDQWRRRSVFFHQNFAYANRQDAIVAERNPKTTRHITPGAVEIEAEEIRVAFACSD